MENDIKFQHKKKIAIIALCNIIIIVLMAVLGITDATSDDYGSQMILFSKVGMYCSWSSVFWTVPLFFLQNTIKIFAWQYLAQIVLILFSFNTILILINRKTDIVVGTVSSLFITILVYHTFIQNLNFTQTAALGAFAGVLLMFYYRVYDALWGKMICPILGVILFIVSIQLRYDVLYICCGSLVLLLLYVIVIKGKILFRGILLWIMAVLICLGLNIADGMIKDSDEQYSNYLEYDSRIVTMVDYPFAGYEDAIDFYSKLGMSENDVRMICRKCESDPEYYSIDRLQSLVDNVSYKWSFSYFADNLVALFYRCLHLLLVNELEYFVYIFIILSFILLPKWKKLLPIGIGLMIGCYMLLFAVMGRLVERVIVAMVMLAILPAIISLIDTDRILKGSSLRILRICIIVVTLGFCPFLIKSCIINQRTSFLKEEVGEFATVISQDKEHLYAYSKGLDQNYKAVKNLLLTSDYFPEENYFYLNMSPLAPFEKWKLDNYDISNVYNESVNSEVIRFILGDDVDIVQTYINEHYCENATLVFETEMNGYTIYKVINTVE